MTHFSINLNQAKHSINKYVVHVYTKTHVNYFPETVCEIIHVIKMSQRFYFVMFRLVHTFIKRLLTVKRVVSINAIYHESYHYEYHQ